MSKTRDLKGKKETPKETPKKTVKEILAFAEVDEDSLIALLNDNRVMRRQCEIVTKSNHDRQQQLRKVYDNLFQKEREANIKVKRFTVEMKELSVKEIQLDHELQTSEEEAKERYMEAAGRVMDTLHIKEEDSGNAQMINSYLKKKFPEVLVALGLTPPEEGAAQPKKKIILEKTS